MNPDAGTAQMQQKTPAVSWLSTSVLVFDCRQSPLSSSDTHEHTRPWPTQPSIPRGWQMNGSLSIVWSQRQHRSTFHIWLAMHCRITRHKPISCWQSVSCHFWD